MKRLHVILFLLAPLCTLSACSLRQPSYNPDLGGFSIYQGSSSDRARMYQETDYRNEEDRRLRRPAQTLSRWLEHQRLNPSGVFQSQLS